MPLIVEGSRDAERKVSTVTGLGSSPYGDYTGEADPAVRPLFSSPTHHT